MRIFPLRFKKTAFTLAFEMMPCMLLIAVGIWITLPFFDAMTKNSPLLSFLLRGLPEWAWGMIFFTPGAIQLRVMLHGPVKARKAAALGVFVFLFFLLVLTLMESPHSVLIPFIAVPTVFEAVAVSGLKKDLAAIECIERKEQQLCRRSI